MAEQHVVVLGQEAHGRRCLASDERRTGDVEQLAAAIVAERAEPRAEAFEDGFQPGQPRPRLRVRHRGRAERGQVPHDHLVRFGGGLDRASEPPFDGGEGRGPGTTPDAARGDLDRREQVHRVPERRRIALGPSLRDRGDELRARARPLREQVFEHRQELIDVDAPGRGSERARTVERALDDGLHERTQGEGVVRRHQVQRPAEQGHPDRAPIAERLGQPLGAEPIQTRPQRDVGISRHLRLHADEPFDRVQRLDPAPTEQHLAFEQRAVERAAIEDARCGGRQRSCVPSLIQFVRQVTPPS